MNAQTLSLNLVPDNMSRIIRTSQFDVGRIFTFTMFDGNTPFEFPEDAIVTFIVGKPDGKAAKILGTCSGSTCSFMTTEQMTSVYGSCNCEIRITSGNTNIGSSNFTMIVEKSPDMPTQNYTESEIEAIRRYLKEINEIYEKIKTSGGLPSGGEVGQVLTKGENNEVEWKDAVASWNDLKDKPFEVKSAFYKRLFEADIISDSYVYTDYYTTSDGNKYYYSYSQSCGLNGYYKNLLQEGEKYTLSFNGNSYILTALKDTVYNDYICLGSLYSDTQNSNNDFEIGSLKYPFCWCPDGPGFCLVVGEKGNNAAGSYRESITDFELRHDETVLLYIPECKCSGQIGRYAVSYRNTHGSFRPFLCSPLKENKKYRITLGDDVYESVASYTDNPYYGKLQLGNNFLDVFDDSNSITVRHPEQITSFIFGLSKDEYSYGEEQYIIGDEYIYWHKGTPRTESTKSNEYYSNLHIKIEEIEEEVITLTGNFENGYNTTAGGSNSHAEGSNTTAGGSNSHAEGSNTTAGGSNSHAEGSNTIAGGSNSHAEGSNTIAGGSNSHVFGKFNLIDSSNTYAEIVGNGKDENTRSNARTLDWEGNEFLAGKLTAKEFISYLYEGSLLKKNNNKRILLSNLSDNIISLLNLDVPNNFKKDIIPINFIIAYDGNNRLTSLSFENGKICGKIYEMKADISSVSVNGNDGQWIDSGTKVNDNIVYKSDGGSYNVSNGLSRAIVTVTNCVTCTVYIRSYAESGYDYTELGPLDASNISRGAYTNVLSTKGKSSSSVYYSYTFTLPDLNAHTFEIIYSKDSSGNNNDDRGYFYVTYTSPMQTNYKFTLSETIDICDLMPTTGTTGQILTKTDSGYEWQDAKEVIISSSTEGSTKKFKLTVDDTGAISAQEVTS